MTEEKRKEIMELLPDEEAISINRLINAWGYEKPEDFEEGELWMPLFYTPQEGVYLAKYKAFNVIAVDLKALGITGHGAFAIRKVYK